MMSDHDERRSGLGCMPSLYRLSWDLGRPACLRIRSENHLVGVTVMDWSGYWWCLGLMSLFKICFEFLVIS